MDEQYQDALRTGEEIAAKVKEVDEHIQQIPAIPGLIGKVQDLQREVHVAAGRYLASLDTVDDPEALDRGARRWRWVAERMEDALSLVDPHSSLPTGVNDSWHDKAAVNYMKVVGKQREALEELGDQANAMVENLERHASETRGMIAALDGLGAALGGIILSALGALISIGTSLTPATLVGIAGLAVSITSLVMSLVSYQSALGDVQSSQDKLGSDMAAAYRDVQRSLPLPWPAVTM